MRLFSTYLWKSGSTADSTIPFQWAHKPFISTECSQKYPPQQQTPQGWHLGGIFCWKIPKMGRVSWLDPDNNKATAWTELAQQS